MVPAQRAARVFLGRVRRPLLEGRPVGGTRWEHGHRGVAEATGASRGRSTGLRPASFRAYCRRTRVGSLLGFARGRRRQELSSPTSLRYLYRKTLDAPPGRTVRCCPGESVLAFADGSV